jgi:small-conductance mechanosensitive channel
VAGRQRNTSDETLVDQRPLRTARKLAALALTPEEQRIAQEVLRISDHEVDLAFAGALRDAAQHPAKPTPETREISARLAKTQAAASADQVLVANLSKQVSAAKEQDRENLQQQLDLAKAQLELDEDEVNDAKADLARAGGDTRDKIQRLLDQHEASQHEGDTVRPQAAAADANYLPENLIGQVRAWNSLRQKHAQLLQARQDALGAATSLTHSHDALEKKIQDEKLGKPAVSQPAAGPLTSPDQNRTDSKEATAAAVSSLRQLSNDQKNLADLDKRIQDLQELADNYSGWTALVNVHQRGAAHDVLESVLWIVLILLLVYLAGRLIDRFFSDLDAGRKRLVTLRAVTRFVIQAIGAVIILFVLFGMPNQTPTIIGLAGAGLTVALKDFIVAFFGWFVLMGRNGIRVGDWVEINGVGGEVVEIGLLRTVLLETGNWADSGHPTGRKVAFVNSFAIEGHYFNFSTSGQWLWDEIQVLIPPSANPHAMVDAIQKLVAKETEVNARMAEEEWQRSTGRYRVRSFTAEPAINLRPTGSGIQVHVRYITRAHERYAMRTRLYQAVVELLHQKDSSANRERLAAAAKSEKF